MAKGAAAGSSCDVEDDEDENDEEDDEEGLEGGGGPWAVLSGLLVVLSVEGDESEGVVA